MKQNQTKHIHVPQSKPRLYPNNACSCKCMTYLTYLTTSQHLCINACSYLCMFMVFKQYKTLISIKEIKQAN